MADVLNTSTDSIELLDEDGNVISDVSAVSKSPSTDVPTKKESSPEAAPVPRGNALYARLAALMAPSVTIEAAIGEMKEMSKQIGARKRSAGVTELWDVGEEVAETGAAAASAPPGSIRPPPKRTGPPSAVVSGSANRLSLSSPSVVDKRAARAGASTVDKSSSSGSEESQDAPAATLEGRSKSTASDISKASNKVCIICYESTSAPSVNPLLTCSVCTLRTHAKCAKPQVDKEDLASARFSFTCASCSRHVRPRSESPKPSSRGAPILIKVPHDKRRKTEDSKPEARRKRLEGEVKKKKSEEL